MNFVTINNVLTHYKFIENNGRGETFLFINSLGTDYRIWYEVVNAIKDHGNILLFDKDYKFLDAAWQQIDGGEQVGANVKAPHDYMMKEVTVKEAGYAYIYVSHENATLVDFHIDDVVVTQTPSNIIQYNEYYPFGMQTAGSWTRENVTGNNYMYNGANELNQTSGWYEMFYRGYDPALGRMLQVDPASSSFGNSSPYSYSFNDPVYWSDPSGAVPCMHCEEGNLVDMGGGGSGYNGPGSGYHWSDQFRSVEGNLALMSINTFRSYYGIDGMSDQERTDFAVQTGLARPISSAAFESGNQLGLPSGIWTPQTGFIAAIEFLPGIRELGKVNLAIYKTAQEQIYRNLTACGCPDPPCAQQGSALGITGNITPGGGFNFSLGIVMDDKNNYSLFFSVGPSVGFDMSLGVFSKGIYAVSNKEGYSISDYSGYGRSHNAATGIVDFSLGGNNVNNSFRGPTYSTYYEVCAGASLGLPIGYSYQFSRTWLFGGGKLK